MTTQRLVTLFTAIVSLGILTAACNRDDAVSQFPSSLGEGGDRHLPIRLVRNDKGILGQAAGGEASAARPEAGGAASAAGRVTVDDSTPEALVASIENIIRAGSASQLPEIVVPDQRETMEQIMSITQPMLDAQAELKKAMEAKFPGHAFQMTAPEPAANLSGGLPVGMSIGNVTTINDDEAEATMSVPGPTGQTTKPVKLRRVEGKWRLEIPDLQAPPAQELEKGRELMGILADAIKGVTERINNGEFSDASAAEEAFGQAMLGALGRVMKEAGLAQPSTGDNEAQNPPAAEDNTQPPADSANPAPNTRTREPRPREQVDEVYSGPGQLRAR